MFNGLESNNDIRVLIDSVYPKKINEVSIRLLENYFSNPTAWMVVTILWLLNRGSGGGRGEMLPSLQIFAKCDLLWIKKIMKR